MVENSTVANICPPLFVVESECESTSECECVCSCCATDRSKFKCYCHQEKNVASIWSGYAIVFSYFSKRQSLTDTFLFLFCLCQKHKSSILYSHKSWPPTALINSGCLKKRTGSRRRFLCLKINKTHFLSTVCNGRQIPKLFIKKGHCTATAQKERGAIKICMKGSSHQVVNLRDAHP